MSKVVSDEHPTIKSPISDTDLKQKFLADTVAGTNSPAAVQAATGPTEIIRLPSRGYFYPEGHPLSSGEVEMKYMSGREEDILSTQSLIRSGKVFDKLMSALLITKFNFDDLLLMDKNALFINTRVLAYGSMYDMKGACPSCGQANSYSVDLAKFETPEVDWSIFTKGQNQYNFTLPKSGKQLTLKFLTHGDDQILDKELEGARKLSLTTGIEHDLTTRLRAHIVAVDGDTSRGVVNSTVNDMLGVDSLALRRYMKVVAPELDTTYHFACSHCDYVKEDTPLVPDLSFFWPGV